MKTMSLILGTLGGVLLFAGSPVRAETVTTIETVVSDDLSGNLNADSVIPEDGTPWREAQPTYEFIHPLKVTCREFLDTEAIYRPFVVAWLSGRSVGVLDVTDPDEFVPVSVPQVVTLCEEGPDDTMVVDVVTSVAQ